jgi:hypothetical protein
MTGRGFRGSEVPGFRGFRRFVCRSLGADNQNPRNLRNLGTPEPETVRFL